MEYYPVLIVLLSSSFCPKVRGIDEDMCIMLCLITVWLAQSESGLCRMRASSLIALPASAASIKHPGNCSPCVQSSWSHEPEFSVQFISQPFWSTPCLLRTTNPISTQHPGSSEQILEVVSAVQDFLKAKLKILGVFLFIFFSFVFFLHKEGGFFTCTCRGQFFKASSGGSCAGFKAYSSAEEEGGREGKIKGVKQGEDKHHFILLCGRNHL